MPARATNRPPSSIVVPILVVGLLACIGVAYFGGPVLVVAWLFALVAAFVEPNVQPTGPKIKGLATPADDRQAKDITTARYWRAARGRLISGVGLFIPGHGVLASWVAAWAAALAAYALPVMPTGITVAGVGAQGWFSVKDQASYDQLSTIGHGANALAAAILVSSLYATARSVSVPASPGVRFADLIPLLRKKSVSIYAMLLAGLGAGFLVSTGVRSAVVVTYPMGWTLLPAGIVAGVMAGVSPPWRAASLGAWKARQAIMAAWGPLWENAKIEPVPTLEDVQAVTEGVMVLIWRISGAKSAADVIAVLPKVVHGLGADQEAVALYAPVMESGQPKYGVSDPQALRVVLFDAAFDRSLAHASSVGEPLVRICLETAMASACDAAAMDRMALSDAEKITDEASPSAAWGTRWVMLSPEPVVMESVRSSGAIRGAMGRTLGCDVLVDSGAGALFVGQLLDKDTVFEDESLAALMAKLDREDLWKIRWSEGGPRKWKANTPTLSADKLATAALPGGAKITREVFLLRKGTIAQEYFPCDSTMATACDSAPMFTTTGYVNTRSDRSGDRIASAIAIYYATYNTSVPTSADRIIPSERQSISPGDINPQAWVLCSMINKGFDAAKLARPEVVTVKCMTSRSARSHLWKVDIRLHGGVTLDAVRAKTGVINQILNVAWLRVASGMDGCVMYLGALPTPTNLENADRDLVSLTSLDWEEAFRQAGVMTAAGEVPTLSKRTQSETNAAVTTLDFDLPAGKITDEKIKNAIPKLRNMTRNDFILMKPGGDGAGTVRLTVAEKNPIPWPAPFDFEAALTMDGNPFASDIEDKPVCLNLGKDSPHLLLAGTSGAGKSKTAQAIVTSWLLGGDDLVVIDTQKNAADFLFAKDWAIGWATDLPDALAMSRALYEETRARIQLYTAHGVADILDLPEDIRPHRILVFVDEFIGMVSTEKNGYDKKSNDPDVVLAREQLDIDNSTRSSAATNLAKLLGEARSAGIHLILATQSLTAKTLESIPGGSNVKNNLGRALFGNPSQGERQSALRAPFNVPSSGNEDIPKGRGLWEPVSVSGAFTIQSWYAEQGEYASALAASVPLPDPGSILNVAKFRPKDDALPGIIGEIPESLREQFGLPPTVPAALDDSIVVSEEEVDLGDFDLGDPSDEPEMVFEIPDDDDEPEMVFELPEVDVDTDQALTDEDFVLPSKEPDKVGYYVPPVVVPDEW